MLLGAEGAADLLAHFHHAQVPLGLVVAEGHAGIFEEALIALAKSDPEAIADLVLMLWDWIEALEARVWEIERNSRDSSRPPSLDRGNFNSSPSP
jgi:hypothetical protein